MSLFERVFYFLGGIWVALTFAAGGIFFGGLAIVSMRYGMPYSGEPVDLADAFPPLLLALVLLVIAVIAGWLAYRAAAKPTFGKPNE